MGSGLLLVLATAVFNLALAGETFQIRNGTIAGGGDVSAVGEFVLISTMGEPAMGTVSNETFRLTSGFPATLGDGGDLPLDGPIFSDGFESFGSD